MNDVILQTIGVVVVLVAAIIWVVGPLVQEVLRRTGETQIATIRASLPREILKAIDDAALLGAQVAEQLGLSGQLDDLRESLGSYAKAKLKRAEEYAEARLQAQGYNVELDAIRGAIEAVVYRGLHLPVSQEGAASSVSLAIIDEAIEEALAGGAGSIEVDLGPVTKGILQVVEAIQGTAGGESATEPTTLDGVPF